MKSDVEIAQGIRLEPISVIAEKLGVAPEFFIPYGRDKAKLALEILDQPSKSQQKLVLVTAISPTPAGEGKTTTSIGLGMGLASILASRGESVCIALREPSLGPCMGVKGGATGGGYSQVMPAASINLHFTGDFHAISCAHNLLAAAIDNHIFHGNLLQFNLNRIVWPRVMDMNDRALRKMIVGMGNHGSLRETQFDITAASEIMAILCLAHSFEDLRQRLDNILIGYSTTHQMIRASALGVTGAMMALLQEAIQPNLVQTLEGTPVLIHGGPFANIAHGCNSILATKMSMHLADWTVTEAGFGCDLGAEKFMDIKCVEAGIEPDAVVIVATVRALKMHGGMPKDQLHLENLEALSRGLGNLTKHIETVQSFNKPIVVAINRFANDEVTELEMIAQHCEKLGLSWSLAEHFAQGGVGAQDLAQKVLLASNQKSSLTALYQRNDSIPEKLLAIAQKAYGAKGVKFENDANRDMQRLQKQGFAHLPICVAKTQNSLSDNPKLLGRPTDFEISVKRLIVNAGAGFIVALTGDIMRMPGLPKAPAAEKIDVENGRIVGIT